jgi:hypothetical protein
VDTSSRSPRTGRASPLRVALEGAALAGLLFHLATAARAWASLPERVPVHFGASGQPDRWGSKGEFLWLPLLSLGLYAGLTWAGRKARHFNYPWEVTEANAERQYGMAKTLTAALKAETMWLFGVITWQSVRVAWGEAEGLGEWFIPVVLVVGAATVVAYLLAASRET